MPNWFLLLPALLLVMAAFFGIGSYFAHTLMFSVQDPYNGYDEHCKNNTIFHFTTKVECEDWKQTDLSPYYRKRPFTAVYWKYYILYSWSLLGIKAISKRTCYSASKWISPPNDSHYSWVSSICLPLQWSFTSWYVIQEQIQCVHFWYEKSWMVW